MHPFSAAVPSPRCMHGCEGRGSKRCNVVYKKKKSYIWQPILYIGDTTAVFPSHTVHLQGPPRAIYTLAPLGLQFLGRTLHYSHSRSSLPSIPHVGCSQVAVCLACPGQSCRQCSPSSLLFPRYCPWVGWSLLCQVLPLPCYFGTW